MADKGGTVRQIDRFRSKCVQELDINKLLPRLLIRRIFTVSEEKEILSPAIPQKRAEVLLDILSLKDRNVFIEFCKCLEECAPHLLTALVLDSHQEEDHGNSLTSELAVKEGDALLFENTSRENMRDLSLKDLEQTCIERDQIFISSESLPGKEKNGELNSGTSTKTINMKIKDNLLSVETDQVYEQTGPNVAWETHTISLYKAPTFGFGIAVSGGYDSPHFANGDPSVAISDVIRAGPAEGKLQINDRIITANGISLENVDHNTAINVLRECGSAVNLVVRRRILLSTAQSSRSNAPLQVTLTKKSKKDEFGIILECKIFIKEIVPNSLASHESSIREGDTVLKINDASLENLSLAEVKKLIDRSKDKLQFTVTAEGREDVVHSSNLSIPESGTNAGLLSAQPLGNDNINIFQPETHPEEDIYVRDPTSRVQHAVPCGAYPKSENTRYDGRYVLDNDPPSYATLPKNFDRKVSRKSEDLESNQHDVQDGYYSDQDDGWRGRSDFVPIHRPGSYLVKHVFSSRSVHDADPRRVTFHKDKQTGLGIRLAGGNATGIFIASVHSRSAAEREGLLVGDKIILANGKNMTGMFREEAVSYLTSLEGQVILIVQYKKDEYDHIMASREAGDSFYIRSHFKHTGLDSETEHSFKLGDIFHVKDTLFRGIGGSWLAVMVSDGVKRNKKGTIPNSKNAEMLKSQQKQDSDKENFPNRGRGSLFRRKSFSRRSKSLGKDHWEQIIFAGLGTQFPAYERVVYREPGFIRPVVIYGAIADIARERLLTDYSDRFDSPQADQPTGQGDKNDKNVVVTLGSIRDAAARQKHCLLDITPYNVDRLNYAQFNPIVIFLKAETKQAVKDIRGRWKSTIKSPRKLLEQSDKMEKMYSHLFTGQLTYMGTDAWFPKLCVMIESQQRHKIWISEKQPVEDMSDDLMFPMSSRFSCTTGTSSHVNISQLQSQLDISPLGTQQVGRFSSDPNMNILENFPEVPPYPSFSTNKNQRNLSNNLRNSVSDISHRSPLREELGPCLERKEGSSKPSEDNEELETAVTNSLQPPESHGHSGDHKMYSDNSSYSSSYYNKYVNSPQNKHDDTKLQEKFGNFQNKGREISLGHDPFTQSTIQLAGRNVESAKLSDPTSRHRKYSDTLSSQYGAPAVPSSTTEKPSEHTSFHQVHHDVHVSGDSNNRIDFLSQRKLVPTTSASYQQSLKQQQQFHHWTRGPTLDPSYHSDQNVHEPYAYANKVYMNNSNLRKTSERKLQAGTVSGAARYPSPLGTGVREAGEDRMQGRLPYTRPR